MCYVTANLNRYHEGLHLLRLNFQCQITVNIDRFLFAQSVRD